MRPTPRNGGAAIVTLMQNGDADRGTFIYRFHHKGARQRVRRFQFSARDHAIIRNRQPGGTKHGLRRGLIHGKRRSTQPGMRVRQAKPIQHALDAAILTKAAMQRVEDNIGARIAQRLDHGGQIIAHINRRHGKTRFLQRGNHLPAR